MSRISALVLAAGSGSRMQMDCPKQFIDLCGKPVLYYSLKAFSDCDLIDEIVLVSGKDDIDYCQTEIVDRFSINKIKKIIAGGSERYWSVWNGLQELNDSEYVLIHDAARPCVTQQIILDSIKEVKQSNACTVGVPVKDTIKIVDENGYGVETPRRDLLWQIQTPQSFSVKMLVDAYEKMRESSAQGITDDTMIMEQFLGVKSKVIWGDYHNIKITTREDLDIVKNFFRKN